MKRKAQLLTQAQDLLETDLRPVWRRLAGSQVRALAKGFETWHEGLAPPLRTGSFAVRLGRFLLAVIAEEGKHLAGLHRRQAEYAYRYAHALSIEEKQQVILDYARDLGSHGRRLRQDERAFARWFGHDAMVDRYRKRVAETERRIAFCLERLGVVTARCLRETAGGGEATVLWAQLGIEECVLPLLAHEGDFRVRVEAFRCLATALKGLPAALQEGAVSEGALQYIYYAALDTRQQVWIQCEAVALIASLSAPALHKVLEKRLGQPSPGDDLFVRARAVEVLAEVLPRMPDLAPVLEGTASDPSVFVRQAVCHALPAVDEALADRLLPSLALRDGAPQVRAAALMQVPLLLSRATLFSTCLDTVRQVLATEHDGFVLRAALEVTAALEAPALADAVLRAAWLDALLPRLSALHRDCPDLAVRRHAAEVRERIWLQTDAAAKAIGKRLASAITRIPSGKERRLPPLPAEAEVIGRVAAVLAQRDFGLDLRRERFRWSTLRGHRFGLRLWRVLHEMRTPSPDKRQAFRHTVGRIFHGRWRAPSAILAELAETKVPGEPLHIASEGGWRPYLPLLDDLIAILWHGDAQRPLRLFTAEGVTEVTPPRFFLTRLRALAVLTLRFAHYARLRHWQEEDQDSAGAYLHALTRLGFRFRFAAHAPGEAGWSEDPAVRRYFSSFFPLPLSLTEVWERLEGYFLSAFGNTLTDLALFIGTAIAAFLGRHLYLNAVVGRLRRGIPLVVGGWGTRGKSGTERLKAALFNALGYAVVSKTTGCEAMFVHAHPYGSLREMFLFRPYDKATIWEQHNIVSLAHHLGCEVLLWECMALTPAFVRLLQRHWMRDDYSTITNTFPDHEDLQGPAGVDIPQVMTNFIPKRGVLFTAETQMRPVLAEAARELGTRLIGVGWLESGLLAPDVLARFPYQEHPDNVALVSALAEDLGLRRDFALKEMADRVVPDLGVLKVFPVVTVRARRLEFSNGMSANERFGCLSNWRRLGFDSTNLDTEPGVMLSTVVNNRADRVARSRVFAGVLVNDISADLHVLIGSNLQGLLGYIREAWEANASTITLFTEAGGDVASALGVLEGCARRLRVTYKEELVKMRLAAMLNGQGVAEASRLAELWREPAQLESALAETHLDLAATLRFLERDRQMLGEYQGLAEHIAAAGAAARADLDQALRDRLWRWFERKLVVVADYYASGDRVIATVVEATAPGLFNRVMGVQNIKGTGLDFVYRWLAWDACYQACAQIRNSDASMAKQGLATLSAFQDYGILCEETVNETVAWARSRPWAQHERYQAEIALVLKQMEQALAKVRAKVETVASTGWMERLCTNIEAFLDAGDAVWRRRQADRIYADLVAERISQAAAVSELLVLNKRQKGGWLIAQIREWLPGRQAPGPQ